MRILATLCAIIAFFYLLVQLSALTQPTAPVAPKDKPRFPFLTTVIEDMDAKGFAKDVQTLSCNEAALIAKDARRKNCAVKIADTLSIYDAFTLADGMIARSRASIAAQNFAADAPLRAIAAPFHFKVATRASAKEALAIYDFAINNILVKHLLKALQIALDTQQINMATLRAQGANGIEFVGSEMQDTFFPKMESFIQQRLKHPNHTLLYIAVGCGTAEKDVQFLTRMHKHHPKTKLFPYCLDPYQSPQNHAFVEAGGVLDTQPLAAGETIITRAQKALGKTPHIAVVTGHYAFHHIGQSFPSFLEDVGDAPVILFETFTNKEWLTSSYKRARKIGVDLLMNLGLDELRGDHWVKDAIAKQDQNIFQVYYLHSEILDSYSKEAQVTWLARGSMMLTIAPEMAH